MNLRALLRPWCWLTRHRCHVEVVGTDAWSVTILVCDRCGHRLVISEGSLGPINPPKGPSYWEPHS